MKSLEETPDGFSCPRHGMEFIVCYLAQIVEIFRDGDGSWTAEDGEDVGTILVRCEACDDNVPKEERSAPLERIPGFGRYTLREAADKLSTRLHIDNEMKETK